MEKNEIEFLNESNKIEREYSKQALEDAKDAWNLAKKHKGEITVDFILKIHRQLMKSLNPRIAGKIRGIKVYVGNTREYRECIKPELIKEELRLLLNPGIYPVMSEEQIKTWHIQFEKIHPFEDGNGRTGRIIMNIQRLRLNLPLLVIHLGNEQKSYYGWFK